MKSLKLLPVLCIALLAVTAVDAQQQQPPTDSQSGATAPLPPLPPEGTNSSGGTSTTAPSGSGVSIGSDSVEYNPSQAIPDTHTLSDSEAFGLGDLQGPHNVFSPSLYLSEGLDTGFFSGTTSWFTTLGGSLALQRFWSRYDFALAYTGGESFYRPFTSDDYSYQNLGFTQDVKWQRWTLRLSDAFTYSPQSTFGGLALGGPGMMGFQLPTELVSTASPPQTVLTNYAQRLQETVAGDLDYQVTPHGVLTFSGSWGLLHFITPGYIDNAFTAGRVGYSYSLNSKDSIGVTYVFTEENYTGYNDFIRAHSVLASYGRKITGKLAFQVGAGPEYMDLLFFAPSPSISQWTWSAFTSLSYHWQRTDLMVSYSHILSNGSGVYLGSITDIVSGTVSHRFTRNWSGAVGAGYSINNDLFTEPGVIARLDDLTGTATFTRLIGQSFNLALGVGFIYQNGSAGACPVATCGPLDYVASLASVTLNWHLIPIHFE